MCGLYVLPILWQGLWRKKQGSSEATRLNKLVSMMNHQALPTNYIICVHKHVV